MGKRGAKPKNPNSNDEDQGSEVCTRSMTPNLNEPGEVSAKQNQFHSPATRDGTGLISMMTESYDSTHNHFFLHSVDIQVYLLSHILLMELIAIFGP